MELLKDRFRNAGVPIKKLETDEEGDENSKAKPKAKAIITLLGQERKRNVVLFVSHFKMKPEEILDKVRSLNLSLSSLLDTLKSVTPTDEEFSFYKDFKGNANQLSNTDNFFRLVGLFTRSVFINSIEILNLKLEGKKNIDKTIMDLLTFRIRD